MKIYFSCTLLSDIVLTSQSATEGFHPSLDYIPGSKFLGIAASILYSTKEENKEETLNIFHRGKVKFSNAYPVCGKEILYPMPYAWFRDKQKTKKEIYLHHKITREDVEKHFSGIQLKQQREGFINAEGDKYCEIIQNFSIKSAYDGVRRKSKDENMYGYFALPAESCYVFHIDIDEQAVDKDKLIECLVGVKHIGRSRSAEYGLINIEKLSSSPTTLKSNEDKSTDKTIVYAVSDLCLFDSDGFVTVEIDPESFGFTTETKVEYELSQIKTRIYQSYNGKRKTRNADYSVIEKGSVIVFAGKPKNKDQEYVGKLLSEGFGQIVYNPTFLMSDSFKRKLPKEVSNKTNQKRTPNYSTKDSDNLIQKMLARRVDLKMADKKIEEVAEKFSKKNEDKFKNISKSQWGAVSGIAKSTSEENELKRLLFDAVDGFLRRGIAEEKWRGKADILEEIVEKHPGNVQKLLVKVASKMQKKITENGK